MAEAIRKAFEEAREVTREEPRPLTRPVDEPEQFPLKALGALSSAAQAIHDHTQAPIAICAQSVLGAVSLVVQAHADVVLPTEATRPLSLFLMTVAESGERKSAVDGLALKPVHERERQLSDNHSDELAAYEVEKAIWEGKHARAQSDLRKGKDDTAAEADLRELGMAPEPPLNPMLVCPEPTFEGYCKLTAAGQPALGLFSAEGGTFIGGFGMAQDHRLKTAAALSGLWDGEPVRRVRAGDGTMMLRGRRLALHLMVQAEPAAQFLGDDLLIGQGILSRMLTVSPRSAAGTRLWRPPGPEAKAELGRYHDALGRLLQTPLPLREGARNELLPRPLPLDGEASRMWIAFHDFVEARIGEGGDFAAASGFANKSPEHAARLAGVLTLWRDVAAAEVKSEEMAQGIHLTQHYLAEAVRLRELSRIDPHLALAERVLRWLMFEWPEPLVSTVDLYQRGPARSVRTKKSAQAVLHVLADHGWIQPIEGGAKIAGKHRKEAFRIHGRVARA